MGANCRGIVTADVLELGLSRGAIATRKLEGVNAGQGTRGFILVRPLTVKVKAYVQLRLYCLGFRRPGAKTSCLVIDLVVLVPKPPPGRPFI